jgi:hypothetical protein
MSANSTLKSSLEYKLYSISMDMNFYSSCLLILIGLFGNLLIIYLLISRQKYNSYPDSMKKILRNHNHHHNQSSSPSSLSSSQTYMIALAISDSLFLFSHLTEDILPLLSSNSLFQFVNHSSLACKLIIHVRNSSRLASSYLVVFFAYERFIVVIDPLKRIKFHNKKLSRFVILFIYLASLLINAYTLIINGLRLKEGHEIEIDPDNLKSNELNQKTEHNFKTTVTNQIFECDVLREYKQFYDYSVLVYVIIGIILPIGLVCFFNIYIAKVLLTRKKLMIKHLFQSLASNDEFNPEKNSSHNKNNSLIRESTGLKNINKTEVKSEENSKEHQNSTSNQPNNLRSKSHSSKSECETIKNRDEKKSPNVPECHYDSVPIVLIKKKAPKLSSCCKSDSLQNDEENEKEAQVKYKTIVILKQNPTINTQLTELVAINKSNVNVNEHENIMHKNHNTESKRNKSFLSITQNPHNHTSGNNHHSQCRNCSHSLAQKLKDSGRATIILILISICFVLLNLPYILTWLWFYVPYKNSQLDELQIHFRYSFVALSEIFHISNFCINFFLYYMASKYFRNQFLHKFMLFKKIQFKFNINVK